MSREIAGKLLLLVLSPLLFFGVLEVAACAIGVEPAARNPHYEKRLRIDDCRWNPDHVERVCGRPRWGPEGRRAILLLGGSSVLGHPPEETRTTIAHHLRLGLRSAHPQEYSVHNLGYPCKDSFFVRSCVARSLEGGPDILVVYSGHNDFGAYMVPRPRLALLVGRNPWLSSLRRVMTQTRAYSLFIGSSLEPLERRLKDPAAIPRWDLEGALPLVLEAYEENLEGIARIAEANGVPLIVVTVVSNLFEYPYRRRIWDVVLERVGEAEDPAPWLVHYARGIELARADRIADALAEFERSRDLYYPSGRAAGALGDVVRAVAARHEHVHLVDFERELRELGLREGEGGIGCNFFQTTVSCDGVHPGPRTNALIAAAIQRQVEALRKAPLHP